MKHCVVCWVQHGVIGEATYVYNGMSLCRTHLNDAYVVTVPGKAEEILKQEDMIRWEDE